MYIWKLNRSIKLKKKAIIKQTLWIKFLKPSETAQIETTLLVVSGDGFDLKPANHHHHHQRASSKQPTSIQDGLDFEPPQRQALQDKDRHCLDRDNSSVSGQHDRETGGPPRGSSLLNAKSWDYYDDCLSRRQEGSSGTRTGRRRTGRIRRKRLGRGHNSWGGGGGTCCGVLHRCTCDRRGTTSCSTRRTEAAGLVQVRLEFRQRVPVDEDAEEEDVPLFLRSRPSSSSALDQCTGFLLLWHYMSLKYVCSLLVAFWLAIVFGASLFSCCIWMFLDVLTEFWFRFLHLSSICAIKKTELNYWGSIGLYVVGQSFFSLNSFIYVCNWSSFAHRVQFSVLQCFNRFHYWCSSVFKCRDFYSIFCTRQHTYFQCSCFSSTLFLYRCMPWLPQFSSLILTYMDVCFKMAFLGQTSIKQCLKRPLCVKSRLLNVNV